MTINRQELESILHHAILAPSADNRHNIRFKLGMDSVQCYTDDPAFFQPTGYRRVLAWLSLGALSENFTLSAGRFGMGVSVTPCPMQKDGLLMAFHLKSQAASEDPLWKMIPHRHTNRHIWFHGPRMTDKENAKLAAAVECYTNCNLFWLDETVQRKAILKQIQRAETERFYNPVLHEELFSAIRFDVGWKNSCEAGLPPGALGVEPMLRGLFSTLRHWTVMRVANRFGAHRMLGLRAAYLPCRLAPHLGMLCVRKTDIQSVLEAGRAFQRLWLSATRQGRVLQPMPASALYALDGTPDEGIAVSLQQELKTGWRAIAGEEGIPLMLFRMGKAEPMPVIAGRETVMRYIEET